MSPDIRFHHLKAAGRSPAHARMALKGEEWSRTSSMERGTAVHSLVFGTKSVIAYAGAVRRGKEWEAFRKANANAEILTKAEYEKANRMAAAIWASPLAMEVLRGEYEHTVRWQYLHRQCRGTPDVRGDGIVVDLKTSQCSDPVRFTWQALRLAYHAQLAWYMDGMQIAGYGKFHSAYVVAVESASPYPVTVLKLTDRALESGRGLYRLWLERLLSCEASDQWPGYSQSIVDLDVPDDVEITFADDNAAAEEQEEDAA